MHSMMCTQLDICYVVGLVNKFQLNTRLAHWKALKKILRYLKGMMDYALCYQGKDLRLTGYSYADWGSDLNEHKSMT
jgi:hypothetical protein